MRYPILDLLLFLALEAYNKAVMIKKEEPKIKAVGARGAGGAGNASKAGGAGDASKAGGASDADGAARKSAGNAAEQRYKYLTETPINRLIPRLAVPTIISMLVTALYNAADTFFVGRISTEATAAVGLAFSVMAIIQAFGFFCGQGSGNYLSRMLGARKQREAEEMAASGLALALIIGVITAALIILNVNPLARFLGATETTIDEGTDYLGIIALGAPFMMSQFVLNNQLRYQGSAIYAMVGLMFGAVLNIGLDPLLIFGLGMGVRGAATATICVPPDSPWRHRLRAAGW